MLLFQLVDASLFLMTLSIMNNSLKHIFSKADSLV